MQARLKEIEKMPHIGRHWGRKKINNISSLVAAKKKKMMMIAESSG